MDKHKKNIDIDSTTIRKLKILSVFEELSVKALMEKAVRFYVEFKEKEQLDSLTKEEKEDLGLLLLMQKTDLTQRGSMDEVFKILD